MIEWRPQPHLTVPLLELLPSVTLCRSFLWFIFTIYMVHVRNLKHSAFLKPIPKSLADSLVHICILALACRRAKILIFHFCSMSCKMLTPGEKEWVESFYISCFWEGIKVSKFWSHLLDEMFYLMLWKHILIYLKFSDNKEMPVQMF